MQNLLVRELSASSCVQSNFSLPFPSSHTSSSLKVAISHFVALVSKCCWVNAWLVPSWARVSNWLRCQAIQLKFQCYDFTVTAVWCCRHDATLKGCAGSDSSEVTSWGWHWCHVSPAQHSLWILIALCNPTTSACHWHQPETTLTRYIAEGLLLKSTGKVFFYCNVLQRKWPGK